MLFIVLKSRVSSNVRCGLYRNMEDLWQASGSKDSFDYYWEIVEKFEVDQEYSRELKNTVDFARSPFLSSDLARAFYFGLQCGRNEKKILKARLDELVIVAGRARWQGTEDGLLGEIETIKKRLADLD